MKGRLDGRSLRVPVPDGSITDLTAVLGAQGDAGRDQRGLPGRFARPSAGGVLVYYTEDPIVSSDIVGSPASCTFDSTLTMAMPSTSRPRW